MLHLKNGDRVNPNHVVAIQLIPDPPQVMVSTVCTVHMCDFETLEHAEIWRDMLTEIMEDHLYPHSRKDESNPLPNEINGSVLPMPIP